MAFSQTDTAIWRSVTQGDSDAAARLIYWIKWVGGTAAGHQAILKNTAGDVIFSAVAASGNYTDFQPVGGHYVGLDVDTLDSGEILIRTD